MWLYYIFITNKLKIKLIKKTKINYLQYIQIVKI